MATTSVVIPVKNGARWLAEVLGAVAGEHPDEVLVIDSGSADDSVAIARAAGATLLEIPAAEFGHGRTRNLALEHTSGELIAYITQDATPVPLSRDVPVRQACGRPTDHLLPDGRAR